MEVIYPHLTALVDLSESISQRGLASPQGLHLGSLQNEAGLPCVTDGVVMGGASVTRNDLDPLLPGHDKPPSTQDLSSYTKKLHSKVLLCCNVGWCHR